MNEDRTSRQPLVAVGLAVYNSERYVRQSIECLLSQTFDDFVLFISDNASTDSSGEICQEYARRDSRIRYTRNAKNVGMVGNYNLLFSYCRSKYFRWATADDYWHQEMLGDAVAAMEADPSLALCYPHAIIVDHEGRELKRWWDEMDLMQEDPVERLETLLSDIGLVHQHLGLMRADVMRRTGLLGTHVASDVGFVAEMILYGKFLQIPRYQIFRRVHEDSSSVRMESEEHMARRYHAANVNRPLFNRLSFHRVLWAAVLRSPLSPRDKVRALSRLTRRVYWDRRRLLADMTQDVAWVARRTFGRHNANASTSRNGAVRSESPGRRYSSTAQDAKSPGAHSSRR